MYLPLQRALIVLLPVLPRVMGGPVGRDFSALRDRWRPQDRDSPWHSHMQKWRTCPRDPSALGLLCSHWASPSAQGPLPYSLHRPSHADAAHVGVEVEEGTDAEGLCHDMAERGPLCWL